MFYIRISFLYLLYLLNCVNCEEGSPCVDEVGRSGDCVRFNKCLSVIKILKENKRPKLCSFEGRTPIVCCTDCNMVNDTRNAVVDTSGAIHFKRGQKAYDECLQYMVNLPYPCSSHRGLSRIWLEELQCHNYSIIPVYAAVGGVNAKRAEYPHMGRFEVQTLMPSVAIIPYPKYKAPSKYHDIALLETEQLIRFSKDVLPACLNTGDAFDISASATGWGALGYRQQVADNLQTVFLQKYSPEECSEHYPVHRHLVDGYDHETQMCYGDKYNPKDTCEGDSGGPLQVSSDISNCVYVVLGVTSYGRACGFAGGSGMYTRVSYYVPWIESIVWP